MFIRSGIPTDVSLYDENLGDSVSVHLAEPPSNSGQPWYVEVYAIISEGEYLVGSMWTAANLQPFAGGPTYANRVIAVCTVPGAKAWMARFQNPVSGLTASAFLASSKCCNGPAFQALEGYPVSRFTNADCVPALAG